MKILRKAAFLAVPPGALFASGDRWHFGGLEVKGDTIDLDDEPVGYWSRSLEWIESDGNTGDERDHFIRLDKMLAEGVCFPLNDSEDKTLPVEDDTLFLIYEDADLDALIALATAAKVQRA